MPAFHLRSFMKENVIYPMITKVRPFIPKRKIATPYIYRPQMIEAIVTHTAEGLWEAWLSQTITQMQERDSYWSVDLPDKLLEEKQVLFLQEFSYIFNNIPKIYLEKQFLFVHYLVKYNHFYEKAALLKEQLLIDFTAAYPKVFGTVLFAASHNFHFCQALFKQHRFCNDDLKQMAHILINGMLTNGYMKAFYFKNTFADSTDSFNLPSIFADDFDQPLTEEKEIFLVALFLCQPFTKSLGLTINDLPESENGVSPNTYIDNLLEHYFPLQAANISSALHSLVLI